MIILGINYWGSLGDALRASPRDSQKFTFNMIILGAPQNFRDPNYTSNSNSFPKNGSQLILNGPPYKCAFKLTNIYRFLNE